uniref:Molybdopterin biosynthesis protein n=1 Tax=Vertebrata isogona TaxID=2006944 RepID=A0A1Z1MFF8_9FLOR|nr:Molybdopterin biosynthesis protein [Vertebrata isogona]ARW64501.1 Molybdopterin biosynthesis protein [Vertebrata isogona]
MINQEILDLVKYHKIKLSEEEYNIYSKQIILEQIGTEGQKKLKETKILVVGAGGLGCPTMMYLAISGVGYIGIVDQDQIETSNLNRQILYNKSYIGKEKTSSAKSQLNNINENCKIITHVCKLSRENNVELISRYDIVIDTTDNFNTRHIIDTTCYKLHKIYIYGAVREFEGQIAVFNYKNGIRYKDLYKRELNKIQNTCNSRGIMGITTGYTGTLQAIEVIKIILGVNKKCKNFILSYNLIEMIVKKQLLYLTRTTKNKNYKKYILLSSTNTLNYSTSNIKLIIDLRDKKAFNIKHIEKSINIPIIKFKLKQTINFINKFKSVGEIMLYCNTKERSLIASKFLIKHSIKHEIKLYSNLTKNRNLKKSKTLLK